MDYESIYDIDDIRESYSYRRLKLLVKMFGHSINLMHKE